MAEITGATIDFLDYVASDTPRVMNIPLAWGDASAQDIWDTLSVEAAKIDNLIYKKLLDRPKGGGKSTLAAGKFTGITVPMNNIQIQFEPQVTVHEIGTVTTPDTAGKVLIDSTALFESNGVVRGDAAQNNADLSHATVLRVVSEIELVTTPLIGGSDNQWDSADSYEIHDTEERAATDGDVIAQDHLEAAMPALLMAHGVKSQIELSTSPAAIATGSGLSGAQDTKLTEIHGELRAIEGGEHHSWFMRIFLAALGNKSSGLPTTPKYRDLADTKDRIDATTDGIGNRDSVALDGD